MKKLKLLVSLLFIIFYHYNYSQNRDVNLSSTQSKEVLQNYIVYSPLVQSKSTNSGVEITATVLATCYGNQSNSLFISPTYCAWDDGLIGMTFSNGSSLTPGQNSTITFKFKKTVTANQTFEYKFSTNGSCSSPQIKITVSYLSNSTPPPPTCTLDAPTNINTTNIQIDQATVSWSQVNGNQGYTVSYSFGTSSIIYLNVPTNTTSVTVTNLVSGTLYGFNVRAKSVYCDTLVSNNNSFTTLCPTILPPTNIVAIPHIGAYIIEALPHGSYYMQYSTLDNLSSGMTQITTTGNTFTGDNFFYYFGGQVSFKFKLSRTSSCPVFSDWITVVPELCPLGNYPSNLVYFCDCGIGRPGGTYGSGKFSWNPVAGATSYSAEYQAINLTNAAQAPLTGSFQSSSSGPTEQTTPYTSSTGIWVIRFRVKSRCSNGTWSDFSPWSSNFAF